MTNKNGLKRELEELECRLEAETQEVEKLIIRSGRQASRIGELRELVKAQRAWDAIPPHQRGFVYSMVVRDRLARANEVYDEIWSS